MNDFDEATIEIFNEYVEEILINEKTDLEEVIDNIYETLISDKKWPKEITSEIISYICQIHDKNESKSNNDIKPLLNEKFTLDEEFGSNVLQYYISTNFSCATAINLFNCTIIDYGMDLGKEESEIVEYMVEFFEESEEKNAILKHILNRLEVDVEDVEYDNMSQDYITTVLGYYFDQELKPDFHSLRINSRFQEIIDYENEMTSDNDFELLYDDIIELDESYDYASDIISILSLIEEDPNNYKKFISNEKYGKNVLKKYFKSIFLNTDEEHYATINEIARSFLSEIIGDEKDPKAKAITLNFYFQSITEEYEKKFETLKKYNISLEEIKKVQKICLISDYYNYTSELVFSPLWVEESSKDEIQSEINTYQQQLTAFIKHSDLNTILDRFDTDDNVRLGIITTCVTNNNDYNICDDIDTLRRINPYLILEQNTNKTYQKKID